MVEPMPSNDRLRQLNIAHGLFSELLEDKKLPNEVRGELEGDLKRCGEEIEKIEPEIVLGEEPKEQFYNIWTRTIKNKKVSEEEILVLKEKSNLFVDANNFCVYTKGRQISDFKKSAQAYSILVIFLQNRGRVTVDEICAKYKVKGRGLNKEKLRTPISRLRNILRKKGLVLHDLETRIHLNDERNYYYLDDSIDFVLAEKIEQS